MSECVMCEMCVLTSWLHWGDAHTGTQGEHVCADVERGVKA